MAFEAGAITGRLGLDIGEFAQGMLQAQSLMSIFPAAVTNFMANPLLAVVGILKDVANGLKSWVFEVAEAADSADELAQSVGVSVEFLTAFGNVAKMSGAGTAEVADAFKFLGKSISEVRSGNEQTASAFARLGVQTQSAAGGIRPLEEIMLDIGDAIKSLPDGAARTAAAMDLLGRGGTRMIPTLMAGKAAIRGMIDEMRAQGGAITQEEAESASKFKDLTVKFGAAWEGIKRQLAIPIIDALTPMLQEWLDWFKAHPDEIKARIKELAGSLVAAVQTMATALEFLAKHLEGIIQMLGVAAGAWAGFKAGATIGSVIPGVGSLVGGLTGAVIGGVAGGAIANSAITPSTNNFTVNVNGNVDDATAEFRRQVSAGMRQIQAGQAVQKVAGGL